MLSLWLFLLPCLSLVPSAPAERGLEFPQYDGKDRVLDINDKNYKKAMKDHSMFCLFYHGPIPDSKELQKRHQMTELVLEVGPPPPMIFTFQCFLKVSVRFCVFSQYGHRNSLLMSIPVVVNSPFGSVCLPLFQFSDLETRFAHLCGI